MEPFGTHRGLVVPLDRVNVDTDQMVPKQFLKRISRTGYGEVLFYDWRYRPDGTPSPEFTLNQPRYQGASVLLTHENFGCGSSREHAVWAIQECGFRVILAPSFADIFYQNCCNNGVLPVVMKESEISRLFERASQNGMHLTVNLETCTVSDDEGWETSFQIDAYRRDLMLKGLDTIGTSLQQSSLIDDFERKLPGYLSARGL